MMDAPSADVPVATDAPEALQARIEMLRAACSSALSVDELIGIAVTQARTALHAAGGVLFALDGDTLGVAASVGYAAGLVAPWSRFPVSAETPAGVAVRERRPQWLSLASEKTRRYPELAPERTGYSALAALPVMSGGTVLGVLGVSFREDRAFSPAERLFLLVLAGQVGDAWQRVRRREEVIDHHMLATAERRRVAHEVIDVFDGARATVEPALAMGRRVCEASGVQLIVIAGIPVAVARSNGAVPDAAVDTLCAATMSFGGLLVVADAHHDARVAALAGVRAGDVRAFLGFPVCADGTPVGVLCAYDERARSWSHAQQQGLRVLAAAVDAQLSLHYVAARDARRSQAAEVRTRLVESLTAAEDIDEAAAVLLDAVATLEGAAGAALSATDEEMNPAVRRVRCADAKAAAALGLLCDQPGPSDAGAVRFLDLAELIGALAGEAAHLIESGITRAARITLRSRFVRGSLTVALTEGAEQTSLRRQLADLGQVGSAVLDREISQRRHQLATSRAAFLTTASTHMEASLDVEDTLQRMARIAVPALAEGCLVYLTHGAGLRLAAASHPDARVENRIRSTLGAGSAFVRGIEAVLRDAGTADVVPPPWLRADQILPTPLRARGKLIGAIVLLLAQPSSRWQLLDETLVATLAAHAAIAIDNAQLYAKRSAEVAALQQRLLPPRLPALPEFELAAYYEAGDRSLDVGGDFYDVVVRAPDRLVLLIGDVCGRGPEAAAITGTARAVLRTVVQDGASPARALWRLNEAMRAMGDRGEYCTAAVVQIDGRGDACQLRLAVGGHPLPLVRRRTATGEVGRHGPMLGLLAAPAFQESEVPLYCDDVVLLYTDGVTEARRGKDFFDSRLAAAAGKAGPSAGNTIARVIRAVEEFRDQGDDDIAIIALRPRGRSMTRLEVPDLRDPSLPPVVHFAISRAVPDRSAQRLLSGRVTRALARLRDLPGGPGYIDVLHPPGRWRVEVTNSAPRDRVRRSEDRATAHGVAPDGGTGLRHGVQTLMSVEVIQQ